MRPRDRALAYSLEQKLNSFDEGERALTGIHDAATRQVLVEQILESIHRVSYVSVIRQRPISDKRADPDNELFDPLKASILCANSGDREEAFWLVFLFVHFGKNPRGGWRFAREVYGRLGSGERWNWSAVSQDPAAVRTWIEDHEQELKRPGIAGGFGNHRKYESLAKTGAVIESYVDWVGPPRTHEQLVATALRESLENPRDAFDILYKSMGVVLQFGRTARFDYLTMLGKIGLAAIEPGSTYMQGSTGPIAGARLLFGTPAGTATSASMDRWLVRLGAHLNIGMQVMEDALCNWQKSPTAFVPFRG